MSAKKIVLEREGKSFTLNENDLLRDRVCSIFKVAPETVYLVEKESGSVLFPDDVEGKFDVAVLDDRVVLCVEGDSTRQETSTNQQQYSGFTSLQSPSQAGRFVLSQSFHNSHPRPLSGQFQARNVPLPAHASSRLKKSTFRRSILLAEFGENGKPMTTGSVHVMMNEESANVESVATMVKAFLNSEEDYTICDVNGFTISDCPGTRGLEFWKAAAKKFLAIPSTSCREMEQTRGVKRKRSAAAYGLEIDNHLQNNSTILQELRASVLRNGLDIENLMQDQEHNIKEAIKKMEDNLKNEIQDLRSEEAEGGELVQILRNLLKCKVCHQVIREGEVAFAQCCGQIVGCGSCVQTWYHGNDICLLCRNAEGAEKTIPFRGLDELLSKI